MRLPFGYDYGVMATDPLGREARTAATAPENQGGPRQFTLLPTPAAKSSPSANGGPTRARDSLYRRFASRLRVDPRLSRWLVSYQGNKKEPGFRWMKYKEGFSSALVESLLASSPCGDVLDPFSGIGTTALTARRMGRSAIGIEIMPVGNLSARAMDAIADGRVADQIEAAGRDLLTHIDQGEAREEFFFPHVRITHGAFPEATENEIANAREFIGGVGDAELATVLTAACVASAEEVSYTRKDGQYLRWDARSGRTRSTKLDKGPIPSLSAAVGRRIELMLRDCKLIRQLYQGPKPRFIDGSCLTELKHLPDSSIQAVVTSPPYANRYDYTRTYALELAWLGYGEDAIKDLRQSLLSATVENRSKRQYLREAYGDSAGISGVFESVDEHPALQEPLAILREHADELGNPYVIRLLEHYFLEMAVVINELARIVAAAGRVFMVNDNVRYHGEEIPVDLILSDLAERSGFRCRVIRVLPRGKGNSSQQMGRFGRREIRKCVYEWERL